jgi:hypothetical protein
MQLIQRSLASRVFLLQFIQVMQEFENIIPWLKPLSGLQWQPIRIIFRGILSHFNCDQPLDITPFQFISSTPARKYLGGVIFFKNCPEKFIDFHNNEVLARLTDKHYQYASCLQVGNSHLHFGLGREIMKQVIALMMSQHQPFWGVASDPVLLRYYLSLGAKLLNSLDNQDNLYMLSWD